MPPAGRRMEEGVSAKVTAAAVLCRGAAGGAAGALLYDRAGAVGGGTDDGLAVNFSSLTAANRESPISAHFYRRLLPADLTLLVSRLPPVPILIEGSLVSTFLSHVLHQLLVSDLLAQVPEVARDDLQVVPGVPR